MLVLLRPFGLIRLSHFGARMNSRNVEVFEAVSSSCLCHRCVRDVRRSRFQVSGFG